MCDAIPMACDWHAAWVRGLKSACPCKSLCAPRCARGGAADGLRNESRQISDQSGGRSDRDQALDGTDASGSLARCSTLSESHWAFGASRPTPKSDAQVAPKPSKAASNLSSVGKAPSGSIPRRVRAHLRDTSEAFSDGAFAPVLARRQWHSAWPWRWRVLGALGRRRRILSVG